MRRHLLHGFETKFDEDNIDKSGLQKIVGKENLSLKIFCEDSKFLSNFHLTMEWRNGPSADRGTKRQMQEENHRETENPKLFWHLAIHVINSAGRRYEISDDTRYTIQRKLHCTLFNMRPKENGGSEKLS